MRNINHFTIGLLFLAFGSQQLVYGVYQNPQNMAHLFLRFRLASQDPAVSMACFSNYIVKSNAVGEAYSRDYSQCLLDAKAGRESTEDDMLDKRITIKKSSQDICERLSTCDSLNTTLEVFDCHNKIGANNTKAVYSISGNASEHSNILQEKYRILDLRHEQCCKLAERSYVELTADNYRNLQDCLEGRIKPSEATTTTTMITTTSNTTPPQQTSTTAGAVSTRFPIQTFPKQQKP